jgi:homoserine O-acetyltransferase
VPISCQPIQISGRNWISRRAAADALYEARLVQAAKGDANDQLWAIEAIMDYDPEPDLDKITAQLLLINAEEDEANPPELGTIERAMKRVRHSRYVLIPASEKRHGYFTHFYAEVWKPYLIEFMKTLGAPLQAAAE